MNDGILFKYKKFYSRSIFKDTGKLNIHLQIHNSTQFKGHSEKTETSTLKCYCYLSPSNQILSYSNFFLYTLFPIHFFFLQ
jgi:hypothetical protein